MEIVIVIIMLLVGFNFVLKLTYHGIIGKILLCAIAAAFIGLMWDVAVSQSKVQISDWLNQPELMLDTSVLLTVDVFFQITFCIMMAKKLSDEKLSKVESVILPVSLWFPGILIFPTLFSLLVEIIFAFPGSDFATLAWTTAGCVFVGVPLLTYGIKWLLPESDLRLELMFMINALTAILGVIATVNGRTAVRGTNTVEWDALASVFGLLIIGAIAGLIINKRVTNKLISRIK